jgi:hypothetical protein
MTTTTALLDEQDTATLAELVARHVEREGPRVGDFVIWREQDGERVYRRISYDWGEDVQTSDGGSFHLGRHGVSFSGSLHPAIPTADLVDTGETREGPVWFFHHGMPGAGRGMDVVAPFRVYAYVGETRLRDALAHWADDENATPTEYRHLLHFVDADGQEVGNYPLDLYGEPVAVGRALRDWERLTGIMARKASDVVTIQGQRATHYGVRVQVIDE